MVKYIFEEKPSVVVFRVGILSSEGKGRLYTKDIFQMEKRGRVLVDMDIDKPLKFPTTSRKNTLVLHLTSSRTEVSLLLEVEVTVV